MTGQDWEWTRKQLETELLATSESRHAGGRALPVARRKKEDGMKARNKMTSKKKEQWYIMA